MKPVVWIPLLAALTLLISSCGNLGGGGGLSKGTQQPGVGPFDENGNYVEAWADNPSKWRKSGKSPSPHELKSDEIPIIAKNDQPPQNSIPLDPASSVKRKTPLVKTSVASRTKSTTSGTRKTSRSSSSAKSTTKSTPATARSKTVAKSTAASSATKSKSSSTAVKPKPATASKPKTTATTATKPKPTKRIVKKEG
mgnify:CR=1 FL=1